MLPLSGATVLEICNAEAGLAVRMAGAMAGKLLAELGARVVRLEPAGGDPLRRAPPFLPAGPEDERSAVFQFLNTGKLLLPPPADARAAAAARAGLLTGRIDVALIEEADPIGASAAARDIPRVRLATWPAGVTAPALTGFGALAVGGLLDMVGEPDREPLRLGGHQASYATGFAAFTAAMALITGRDAGAPAQEARVSLVETVAWINWKAVVGAEAMGRAPTRQGARAEFQVLACADGHVAFIYTLSRFDDVQRMIGDPALLEPIFADPARRAANLPAFFARLKPWFAARTREQIYAAARDAGVPLGPVYSAADLLDDPHFAGRDAIARIAHPTLGELALPRLPLRWNGQAFDPVPARSAAPALEAG